MTRFFPPPPLPHSRPFPPPDPDASRLVLRAVLSSAMAGFVRARTSWRSPLAPSSAVGQFFFFFFFFFFGWLCFDRARPSLVIGLGIKEGGCLPLTQFTGSLPSLPAGYARRARAGYHFRRAFFRPVSLADSPPSSFRLDAPHPPPIAHTLDHSLQPPSSPHTTRLLSFSPLRVYQEGRGFFASHRRHFFFFFPQLWWLSPGLSFFYSDP